MATHNEHTLLLSMLGDESSPELARLAEDGNSMSLVHRYNTLPGEVLAFTEEAPYFDAQTVEIDIPHDAAYPLVTVASLAISSTISSNAS